MAVVNSAALIPARPERHPQRCPIVEAAHVFCMEAAGTCNLSFICAVRSCNSTVFTQQAFDRRQKRRAPHPTDHKSTILNGMKTFGIICTLLKEARSGHSSKGLFQTPPSQERTPIGRAQKVPRTSAP